MKTYTVKPEYLQAWQAYPMDIITEEDIERFSNDWDKSVPELKAQLIENTYKCYTPIHRFVGNPGWQELNDLIDFDEGGANEPYFKSEEDYKQGIKDGFVKYDGYYTTIFADD